MAVPMQGTTVRVLIEVVGGNRGSGRSRAGSHEHGNLIAAEKAGQVNNCNVKTGDTVGGRDVVVVIESGSS